MSHKVGIILHMHKLIQTFLADWIRNLSVACIISLYCFDSRSLAGSDTGFIKPDAQNWLLLNF